MIDGDYIPDHWIDRPSKKDQQFKTKTSPISATLSQDPFNLEILYTQPQTGDVYTFNFHDYSRDDNGNIIPSRVDAPAQHREFLLNDPDAGKIRDIINTYNEKRDIK